MIKQNKNCLYCKTKEGDLHKETCDLETKRGKPHFYRTIFCSRCGEERPKIFKTTNKEWQKVTRYYYNDSWVLCKKCFNYVKKTKEKWKKKGVDMFRADVNKRFLKKLDKERDGNKNN